MKIKKRIQKALNKIDEKEHNVIQFINNSNDSNVVLWNEIEQKWEPSKLPAFTNLIGLRLMIMSSDTTQNGKK